MVVTYNSITGLNALEIALEESGVEIITAVAGFPITDFMNQLLKDEKKKATWVMNEKIALEMVLGASVSGKRGAVLVKHVGMNILSDPLITSTTHRIGAGIVIFAGDDPGAFASQNEQDSRWYGNIAEVCVFDPSTPENAYKSVIRAFELSEEVSSSVIIRITDRLLKSISNNFKTQQIEKPKRKFFDTTIWELRIYQKHQLFHLNIFPILIKESENAALLKFSGNELGIISSGFVSTLVNECIQKRDVSHLSLNIVHPLPFNILRDFIQAHKKVLIIEESESVIETQLCIEKNIFGKKTGHVPYGLIELEDVKYAINNLDNPHPMLSKKSRITKRESICENCPFLPLYLILRDIDLLIAGDLGCSIRATHAPLKTIDTGYALGSAIAVACGFSKKGIAVIGDFALSHSGLISLINAVQIKANILVIILQNDIAAMTGGQKSYDLTKVVQAITENVFIFDIEKEEKIDLFNLITNNINQSGISVIFIKGKCKKYS